MKATNFDEATIEIEELEKQIVEMQGKIDEVSKERDTLKDENLRTFRKLLSGVGTPSVEKEETISVKDFNFPKIK